MNFRYDLNGLRALAVVFVVLYHFKVSGFNGGFIGVDIFFVISGFLMFNIINNGVENGDFNFLNFYKNRAIRIIPALFVMILTILFLAYIFFELNEFKYVSSIAVKSLLFVSNITYSKIIPDYFEGTNESNIFLHTWSLSVEWVFYLTFPVMLVIVKKLNIKVEYALIVIVLISLSYSQYLIDTNYNLAFYSTLSRCWEMAIGAITALVSSKFSWESKALGIVGGVFIGLSLYMYSSSTIWPGIYAALPTIGTALIILSKSLNSASFYKNTIVQLVGKSSYSIYLWHWPIVLIFEAVKIQFNLHNWFVFLIVLISFLIGIISYKYIEIPTIKFFKTKKAKVIGISYCCSLVSILLLSKIAVAFYPFTTPINEVEVKNKNTNLMEPRYLECMANKDELKPCKFGSGNQLRAVIIGDSHAIAVARSISNAAKNGYIEVLSVKVSYAEETVQLNLVN